MKRRSVHPVPVFCAALLTIIGSFWLGVSSPVVPAKAASYVYFNGLAGWSLWQIDSSRTLKGGAVWGDDGSQIQVVTIRTLRKSDGAVYQQSSSMYGYTSISHLSVAGTSTCRWTIYGGAVPAEGTNKKWGLKCQAVT